MTRAELIRHLRDEHDVRFCGSYGTETYHDTHWEHHWANDGALWHYHEDDDSVVQIPRSRPPFTKEERAENERNLPYLLKLLYPWEYDGGAS